MCLIVLMRLSERENKNFGSAEGEGVSGIVTDQTTNQEGGLLIHRLIVFSTHTFVKAKTRILFEGRSQQSSSM
jgi:hypothetical protein